MRKAHDAETTVGAHLSFPLLRGRHRRILIASDTLEQINGCAHTLRQTIRVLRASGHDVSVLCPADFIALPNPIYPDVPLALPGGRHIAEAILAFRPHSIHIATEGPVGIAVRAQCLSHGWPFTSSFHTLWPDYLHLFLGIPQGITWRALSWFHHRAARVMVSTSTLETMLRDRGFTRLARWSRGIDLSLFRPKRSRRADARRPISLFVGRVSTEKNIEEFLALDLPGTKRVVGDGPQKTALEKRFTNDVRSGRLSFLGFLTGEALAAAYADADVFVFPSRTDTFGIVLLEALASGLPVAAYPIGAAPELIVSPQLGAVGVNLREAVTRALAHGDRDACRARATSYSWEGATEGFLQNLVPASVAPDRRVTRMRLARQAVMA